jgi:hypothetical protein
MSVAEPVVVLVEGRSDVAAVITFMRSAGINAGEPVDVIDMGGVTNIRRHLEHFTAPVRARRILGLCDAGDAGVFLRALQAREIPVDDPDGMARYGFHVSRADLEDELIRSLGTDAVLGVLTDLGLRERFEGLRRQRYWRDRDLPAQLHRFAGIASGRKVRVARALADGDVIPDYGGRHATFQVAELDPGRAIVYTSRRGQIQLTWSIVLRPMMADAQHCRVLLRLRMAQVRHRRLATTLGELLDALTIAGLAAGLRERVGGTSPR